MKTVQVLSEAYSSPAMLDAYTEINDLPREPDDNLKRIMAPLKRLLHSLHTVHIQSFLHTGPSRSG